MTQAHITQTHTWHNIKSHVLVFIHVNYMHLVDSEPTTKITFKSKLIGYMCFYLKFIIHPEDHHVFYPINPKKIVIKGSNSQY